LRTEDFPTGVGRPRACLYMKETDRRNGLMLVAVASGNATMHTPAVASCRIDGRLAMDELEATDVGAWKMPDFKAT